ncbi:aryl-alcohol dehydrogenase-like predicted oxidoreductase [Saccharopolyspora erythraea NRRL 2338]|uniref:Oxidoreductase n=2 Tax=Saccharopolyspora erythraea TaxID=1836 RepID=A4FFN8_SACEN|nr:aldo/keto reductase [Saccharopolyspora erythraea]EQD83148.1 aldo/keto reductase [Saccharopolyspora erythraea D]PFG96583.1 aryl-alcohol dehydrogenase-like predicted oxidoreductase [Saccharopolyspora erythraea NRRL 2338]QRK93062.1 aldo/keto reductase [Saccharopolyspora erythraea]CAM02863.1 oxidoreductase [Saccharopolyspora erythraea NRRL 2338]
MEHRQLGRSGLRVSRLALGTMTWGLDTDAEQAADQLVTFHDAGGTLVDTADVYQDGHSEEILGDLLTTVLTRDDVVLATKAVARRHDGPFGGGASRAALLSALDGSLRRLRTDHIDLWQLHAWDPAVPLDETLAALDTAITSGRVRYAGVSNYAGWQLATAATHQQAHPTRTPLTSHQAEYSLVERGIEREALPAATHHGIGTLAWAPLGRGVLTGKYRNTTPAGSRGADPHLASYVDHHRTPRANRIVQAAATAAEGLGTTPLTVALAWVRDRPGITAAIIGTRTTTQLKAALNAEELTLPPAIQAALDDVSEPEQGYPERGPARR